MDEAHRQHGDERSKSQRRRGADGAEVCRRRGARRSGHFQFAKPYQDAVSISKLQLLISPSVAFHPGSVAFTYSRGKHMKPLSSSAAPSRRIAIALAVDDRARCDIDREQILYQLEGKSIKSHGGISW